MSFPLFNNIKNMKSNSELLLENSNLKFFNEFLSVDNNILSKKNKELELKNTNLINKIKQLENKDIDNIILNYYYKILTLIKIKQKNKITECDEYDIID
jgi:hypothetical protein